MEVDLLFKAFFNRLRGWSRFFWGAFPGWPRKLGYPGLDY